PELGVITNGIMHIRSLGNAEFQAIHLQEQIVREVEIRLVYLVDENHRATSMLCPRYRPSKRPKMDIIAGISRQRSLICRKRSVHTQLSIIEPVDSVIGIKQVLRSAGRLNIALFQGQTKSIRHSIRQAG